MAARNSIATNASVSIAALIIAKNIACGSSMDTVYSVTLSVCHLKDATFIITDVYCAFRGSSDKKTHMNYEAI
jgi:hypothetical protein